MLNEIICTHFSKSPITFTSGLNIVLGDNKSSNSIGKSTLLMIIDFAFGGKSYIEENSGSIKQFGDHDIAFSFKFGKDEECFIRNTENHSEVWKCSKKFEKLNLITINEFTSFLSQSYNLETLSLSFRSAISLYSRIWGKQNSNVNKPLQSFDKETESSQIANLIKLFDKFDLISNALINVDNVKKNKQVVDGMYKQNYVRKITKTEYKSNVNRIEEIDTTIKDIQDSLLEYTLNVEQLSSKEIINLKTEKHRILDNKSLILNKLRRIDISLSEKSKVNSKQLERLSEFFENPNTDKINEIESFHNKLSKILRKQLLASKKVLEEEIRIIDRQLEETDSSINSLLEGVESPKYIIDKVLDLTVDKNKLKGVNKYYEEKQKITSDLKEFNETLDDTIGTVLDTIEVQINTKLSEKNLEIYPQSRKAPNIVLNRKSHTFNHVDNTGTGKSYIDLLMFDCSILELTKLPFLIHDSFLFKNIEDQSVDNLIKIYSNQSKQVFISIDGIDKYQEKNMIKGKARIELSNEELLFTKDWR